MRHVLTIMLAVHLSLMAVPHSSAQRVTVDHERIAREALALHLQPAYSALKTAFLDLQVEAARICKADGDVSPERLRASFANAVKSWGRIAHIHFGPIRQANRYERIWFWPDRKGIGRRQVANAIRNQPESYKDAETLGGKSIAVQGLGALEQILYGPDIETIQATSADPPFLCGYIQAITGNLVSLATTVDEAWRDENFARVWLQAGPDNPSFLTQQETTFALAQAFMTNAERVRDVELARPLGVTQSRRILSGPFARSQLSMVFIAARIEGLRSLFVESGLSEELLRAAQGAESQTAAGDVRQVVFELRILDQRSSELAEIRNLLGDPDERSKAIALGFPLKSIQQISARALGALTDLPVGFNASDGD